MQPVDFSEGIDPIEWAELPNDGRVMVGGRTVWTRPPAPGLLVTQPNRWGLAEDEFPAVRCLVEIDPFVAGLLTLPVEIDGWLDRRHRPVPPPEVTEVGRRLLEAARRLGARLEQTRSVRLLATPNARTVVFSTPSEPGDLIREAGQVGIGGLRAIPDVAGAVAATVRPEHTVDDAERLVRLVAAVASRRVGA